MDELLMDVTIAARSLAQHRSRTALLGGAIAGVTLLFVLLTGLTTGIRNAMMESAFTLATGHLNIGGFYKVTSGQSAPVVVGYKAVIDASHEILGDELDYVVHRGRGWARLISDTTSMQVGIGGLDIANEPGFKKIIKCIDGKIDDLSEPGTLLIFEEQSKKLGVKVGDTLTFSASTTRGVNNTIDVRVVAIAENIGVMSNFNVYVPTVTLRALYQLNDDTTGAILLYTKHLDRVKETAGRMRVELEKKGFKLLDADGRPFWQKFDGVNRQDWTGQKLDVTLWEDEIAFLKWPLDGINFIVVVLVSVLLIIIVGGIVNTMFIAIRERTREIGTMRAIGMQRGRILRMFLVEAFLLGLGGTVTGALLGGLAALLVNALHIAIPLGLRFFLIQEHLGLVVLPSTQIAVAIVITVVTTIAAFYPSLRAAKLKPVIAMGHAG